MFLAIIVFIGLLLLTLFIQIISKMKVVGGNELGIIAGRGGKKGVSLLSGGRTFVVPLLNKFAKLDLTPNTLEVSVESAIANGIVPLNVKATVSFAISSNMAGRYRAVTRILSIARNWKNLQGMASDIIEGHLRDSIASITPEQVMTDKDALVARMIEACKSDLENIGLEITTMNIADVDDHRLSGVEENDLYIALLKRVQTANAQTKARVAQAESKSASVVQQESRRAEIEVKSLLNELENLKAETAVLVKQEKQNKALGVSQAIKDGEAVVKGLKLQITAEKENFEKLKAEYDANIITPAQAKKEEKVMKAKAEAAIIRSKAQAEIDQLKNTMDIITKGGQSGRDSFILEHFQSLFKPFAQTMDLFKVDDLRVITGANEKHEPLSAVHPDPLQQSNRDYLGGLLSKALGNVDNSTEAITENNTEVDNVDKNLEEKE